MSLQGWECPRCRKIHGPFVQSCDCPKPVTTTTDSKTECLHEVDPGITACVCRHCGEAMTLL